MGDEEDFELIPDDTDVSEESSFLTEEQINDYLEYIGKDKKQVIKEFLEFRPDVQVAYETLAELDPELLKELENTIIEQAYYTAQLQNIKDDILSKAKTPEDKKRLKDETADERHKLTEAYKTAIFKISDDFVKKYGATSEARKKFLEAKSTGSSSEDVPSNIDVQGEGGITVPDPAPSEYVEEEIILEDDEDELEEVIEPDDDIEIEIPIDIDDDEDEEIIVVDDDSTLGDAPASIELGNIDCQNFFDTYSDGMYGSNQRVFREMCIYIYNGVEYEYRQIMKIVNDAVAKGNPIPKITVKYDAKYLELINKLVSKGFTEAEAFIILESIDDQGACSYATTADNIFYFYRNNPEQFEKDFGYPMYTVDSKGNVDFNYEIFMLEFFNYSIMHRDYKPVTTTDVINILVKDDKVNVLPDLALPLTGTFGQIGEYLAQYGIDIDVLYYEQSNNFYNVDDIIASENFDLYFESENFVRHLFKKGIKSHYMYITDFSTDGQPIVSTYGERYTFDNVNANWTSKVTIKEKIRG